MSINENDFVGFALDPQTGGRHKFNHLPLSASWEPHVYRFEDGDKSVGGIDGIDNLPTWQLGNRTEYLYALVLALQEDVRLLKKANKLLMRLTNADNIKNTIVSDEQPMDAGVWIQTEGTPHCDSSPDVRIVADDGEVLVNPVARIVADDGTKAYVTSNWQAVAADEAVRVGSAYRLVYDTGVINANSEARIVQDDGLMRYVRPNGSSYVSNAPTEEVSTDDIDAIFQ